MDEVEENESRELVSTVEELIMQALAGSIASGAAGDSVLTEPAESISLSEDGSVSDSQPSLELREMLQAVITFVSVFFNLSILCDHKDCVSARVGAFECSSTTASLVSYWKSSRSGCGLDHGGEYKRFHLVF